jgi:predicted phage terminase large subunit-like protein
MKTTFSRHDISRLTRLNKNLKYKLLLESENFSETDAQIRTQKAKKDLSFFASTYLPHHIRNHSHVGLSAFHSWLSTEWCLIAEQKESHNIAVAAPRGEAKSTYLLAYILWCFLFQKKHFVVYIMDSLQQAEQMITTIHDEISCNLRIKQDFQSLIPSSPSLSKNTLTLGTQFRVVAKGAKQRLRGLKFGAHRPDLILLDDIENDQNVQNPKQRDKLHAWLSRAVHNLGEAGAVTTTLLVGTVLHHDSLLARLLKDPLWTSKKFSAISKMPERQDLWQKWEHIFKNKGKESALSFYRNNQSLMDKGSLVNWPGKRSLVDLMELKLRIGQRAFASEQQNHPQNDAESFKSLSYWEEINPQSLMVGAVDPSLGKTGGDPSAIIIAAVNRQQACLDIVEALISRIPPDEIISNVIRLQQQYDVSRWYVENVQFQEFLRHELVHRAAKAGIPLSAQPVNPRAPKNVRIDALRAPVSDGRIRFSPQHTTLIEQLSAWPLGDHDDGPDALAMLWKFGMPQIQTIPDISQNQNNDRLSSQLQNLHAQSQSFMQRPLDDDAPNPAKVQSW